MKWGRSESLNAPHALKPTLSFPVLVLYGLGTTIGAGIYALLGVVAGSAGRNAPVAFIAASFLASFTALSFCELSARMPRAGGEATYVHEALRSSALTRSVGLLIALAGCISAATVTRGFTGYAAGLMTLPEGAWMIGLIVMLGAVAAWGIGESAGVAVALTLIETGALLLVIAVNGDALAAIPERLPELIPPLDFGIWSGIGAATLLCFYAFLGFEDMVNVAEEVRDARRVMPIAILATLACTVGLYVALSTVAVLAASPEELAASDAPVAFLYQRGSGRDPRILHLIGMLAMLNGALIQIIKASRLLYGLAMQGQMPRWLAYVHPRTRTPLVSTFLTAATALVFALALPIAPLAELTSTLTLAVFALANLSLCVIKRRDPEPQRDIVTVPWIVPVLGFVSSLGFVLVDIGHRLTVG